MITFEPLAELLFLLDYDSVDLFFVKEVVVQVDVA